MLQIKNLTVKVAEKVIINNLDIAFLDSTTTYLLGPNGAGKSSFAMSLIGYFKYNITGEINLNEINISDIPTYKRARNGLFVSLQYPQDLPGIMIKEFIFESYKAILYQDSIQDIKKITELFDAEFAKGAKLVGLENIENRFIEGLSGGQKKRLELLQIYLTKPKCIVLDEIDSGMDEDGKIAIKNVLKYCKEADPNLIVIIITHNKDNQIFSPDRILFINNGVINE